MLWCIKGQIDELGRECERADDSFAIEVALSSSVKGHVTRTEQQYLSLTIQELRNSDMF